MTAFTIQSPVEVGGKTYSRLTLRKAKAKDLVSADLVQGDVRKSFAMFASICDVPIQVIEELDLDDFTALTEAAVPFLGRTTTAKSE